MGKKIKSMNLIKNKRNVVFTFAFLMLIITFLMAKLAWIQFINDDFYRDEALKQQTNDVSVTAKRGDILDRNGNVLATSIISYNLYCYPNTIKEKYTNDEITDISEELEKITYISSDEIFASLTKEIEVKEGEEETAVLVADELTLTQVQRAKSIRINDSKVKGFSSDSSYKRKYPYGDLASQLLGSLTIDRTGRSGLEMEYDQYLSGINGRWVKLSDVDGNELESSDSEYYDAQNGLNVVTTIDSTIQYYAEEVIKAANEAIPCERIMCLIMNPSTGEILANVVSDGFDPNSPYVPSNEEDYKYLNSLEGSAWVDQLSLLWRNPIVSNVYELGSIFKIFTATAIIEEEIMSETDTLYCGGTIDVDGEVVACSEGEVHGVQTLREAIGNSCNVALSQMAFKLGKTRLYEYYRNFGLFSTTGIEYPAEASPIVKNENTLSKMELANMSFGQGIAVTPLQYLTSANAIVNGGYLVVPRYVSKLVDDDGNTVISYEKEVVRQVISNKTSDEMKDILLYSATKGTTNGRTNVPGYKVGGKTGTAEKYANGSYSEQVLSYVGFAPMENPQISILVVMDEPKETSYAAVVITPIVRQILEKVLPYVGLEPNYTDEELNNIKAGKISTPNVVGKSYEEAKAILEKYGLEVEVADSKESGNFTVTAQYPTAGSSIYKGYTVYLYRG